VIEFRIFDLSDKELINQSFCVDKIRENGKL